MNWKKEWKKYGNSRRRKKFTRISPSINIKDDITDAEKVRGVLISRSMVIIRLILTHIKMRCKSKCKRRKNIQEKIRWRYLQRRNSCRSPNICKKPVPAIFLK